MFIMKNIAKNEFITSLNFPVFARNISIPCIFRN